MNPNGSGIPYWIFVYIPITVPIGQALMRGLKYFEFSTKLKKDHGDDLEDMKTSKDKAEPVDVEVVEKKPKKNASKKPRVAKAPPTRKSSNKKDK